MSSDDDAATEGGASEPQVVYKTLDADAEQALEVESLCVQCEEQGRTRLLCVSIPHYRAVIVMSFECPHCGYRNNEIQSGEAVAEHGTEIVLRAREAADLRRQLVMSDYASIEVPELELEMPPRQRPGMVTTVEGVLSRVREGLQHGQVARRVLDPEAADKIDTFCQRIDDAIALRIPWTLKLHDPTGNCFIENPDPLHVDARCITTHYHRSLAERKLLALAADDEQEDEENKPDEWKSFEDAKHEVLSFPTDCPNCGKPTETKMKPTDIPHFQTVIIMSTTCDACGHKTNEVKSGGATQPQGVRLEVRVEQPIDLTRDVLISNTCRLEVPELELELGWGTAMSGRFSTVEGTLRALRDHLNDQAGFFLGDSAAANDEQRETLKRLLARLDAIAGLQETGTLVLDDAAGNSYVQSLADVAQDDARLKKTFYDRSFEQNEELGLNDMRTENYAPLEAVVEQDDEEQS